MTDGQGTFGSTAEILDRAGVVDRKEAVSVLVGRTGAAFESKDMRGIAFSRVLEWWPIPLVHNFQSTSFGAARALHRL